MQHRFRNKLYVSWGSFHHRISAKSTRGGGIHSPFLFRFITTVLGGRWPYYAFRELEALAEIVEEQAGKNRKHPARHGRDKSVSLGQMLFRIVHDLRPEVMVEIGAADGYESLYLAKACPVATYWCLTSEPGSTSETLRQNEAGSTHVRRLGSVQDIRTVLQESGKPGLVLFNQFGGKDFRQLAFQACIEQLEEDSVFLFLNIHETPEQTRTWNLLIKRPEVRVSIDLFRIGIVFFRPEWPVNHYKIKTKSL